MKVRLYILIVICLLQSCYNSTNDTKLDSSEKMIQFLETNAGIFFDTILKPTSIILLKDYETKHRKEFSGTEFYITSENMKSAIDILENTTNKNIKFDKTYSSETYKSFYITDSKNEKKIDLLIDLNLNTNQVSLHN